MKTISDILRKDPVWVNPAHRVETVILLMRGHNIDGIPVIENNKLVGMILYKHLIGVDLHTKVSEVMQRDIHPASPTMNLRDAAEQMMREELDRIPVLTDEGDLLGVISNSDLLAELRRATDPLTELLWSDSMREWAIEKLRSGHEITILFLDIDGFGLFNKRYGHVVGDTVLRNVSNVLRDTTDASLDLVCRYGGDEFCIATIRAVSDSNSLSKAISQEIASLRVLDACGDSISISIGMRGGRRTKEREQVHFAATLNNLINLASRDCLLKKTTKAVNYQQFQEVHQESEAKQQDDKEGTFTPLFNAIRQANENINSAAEGDLIAQPPFSLSEFNPVPQDMTKRIVHSDFLHLSRISISDEGKLTKVLVALEDNRTAASQAIVRDTHLIRTQPDTLSDHNISHHSEEQLGNIYTGELCRKADSSGLKKLVAETTIAAYRQALPPEHDLRLNEVLTAHTEDGRTLVTVIGHYLTPEDARPIAGSAFVNMDIHRAVAMAVLAAANLQFRRTLAPDISGSSRPIPPANL